MVQKVKRSGETFQHLCKESPSINYHLATVQNIAQAQMKYFAHKNHSTAKCCVCVLPGSETETETQSSLWWRGGILYTVGHSPATSFQNNAGYYSRAMEAGKNIQRSAQMLNRARWFPAETREENPPSPRPFDALPRLRRLNFLSGQLSQLNSGYDLESNI